MESLLPRKKSLDLTEAELRLMEIVWDKGTATVGEVAEALHHIRFRSALGDDDLENLITLCSGCHRAAHR